MDCSWSDAGMNAYRGATVLFSALIVLLGVVMIGVTAVNGGGQLGFILGVLFIIAGAGRLYVQSRS